jgi:hypothetical protein
MEINKCGVCGSAGLPNQRSREQLYSMELQDPMARPLIKSAPSSQPISSLHRPIFRRLQTRMLLPNASLTCIS